MALANDIVMHLICAGDAVTAHIPGAITASDLSRPDRFGKVFKCARELAVCSTIKSRLPLVLE